MRKRPPLFVSIALGIVLAIGILVVVYKVIGGTTTFFSHVDTVQVTMPNGGFSAEQNAELDSIYSADSTGAAMRAIMDQKPN
jgi:hypothetical protein